MDLIDSIQCAGQFLILIPEDVSEWILCGKPIQLFSLTSARASDEEERGKKTLADKETETHKHKPPPRSAYLISQPFFLDIFARRKGNPSMLLILLCLTPVCFFPI